MNEQQWRTTDDLERLLQFLRIQPLLGLKLVDRKLMYWMADALLALSANERGSALVVAFAEGKLSVKDFRRHEHFRLLPSGVSRWLHTNPPLAAIQLAQELARGVRVVRRGWDPQRRVWIDDADAVDEWEPRRGWLVGRLRELFGNPWAVADPAWRHYHGGVVARLAAEIEADQAWELLPILGDALEDAGCAEADVLAHCRSDAEHRKGCWVIDLLRVG